VNKEIETLIDFSVERKLQNFNLETLPKARTQIFITSDIKSVFTSLSLACKELFNDLTISKNHYKVA